MKLFKRLLTVLLIGLGIAQFFKPNKNNGDYNLDAFYQDTKPTKMIKVTLQNACFDCHTNHTNYPWYNGITPINYWLNDHIKQGKEDLNFSKWKDYSNKRKSHKLDEVIETIEDGKIPLKSYTYTHPEVKLTNTQKVAIKEWIKQVQFKYSLAPKPQ